MVLGRRFKIWLVSFAVILVAFMLYRSNTGAIKMVKLDYDTERGESSQLISESGAGQVGQTKLEYLERARFETVDEKTRKLKRVVGFEKVLHKIGDEWELDKPYMNVFQDNLRYNVTADKGTIELENVEGRDPVPKSAVLTGNVIIHILPEMVASMSDSFVYLDEITFDSDRSMLYSDNDVNFISADAHLTGRELEIVYNSITNRLEYLKIKHINFLHIKKLEQTNPKKKEAEQITPSVAASAEPAEIEPAKTASAQTAAAETKPAETEPVIVEAEQDQDDLQCLFRDNVILEHKEDEVVFAGEIMISNLLLSSPQSEQKQPQTIIVEKPQTVAEAIDKPTDDKPVDNKPADETTKENPDELLSVQEHGRAIALLNSQKPVIARLKCDGPMMIRPSSSAETDNYKPEKFRNFLNLPDRTLQWLGRRNVLLAQQIDYDYGEEIAKAKGKVELVFYPAVETGGEEPFIIGAQKGAEFISAQNQALFYGNVKGSFNKHTDYYDEENIFYGDRLMVDLTGASQSAEFVGSSGISHVTVTGPGVRLESIRRLDGKKLSHVRLKSKRIDYDRATEDIIAAGKGTIEYGNTETDNIKPSKSTMDQPCYALVEGFDRLIWDTNSLRVKAFSDKSKGIHIGYIPIEKDKYGNRITIDTRQIDIEYIEPEKGKTRLKNLRATGGIVYYEQPRYEFVGQDIHLNGLEEFLTVSGTEDMPCMLNGVFANGIEYNIKTGSANAVLGRGIGVMPVRE